MPDTDPKAWLQMAEEDLALAQTALDADVDRFSNSICYHCQQAAEKCLKALLVAASRPYPRIHDLVELIRILAENHSDIGALTEDAAWLTDAGGAGQVSRAGRAM